jgi:hypothetical protein
MAIKSNAAPVEKTSPFYLENEERCMEFKKFIAKHQGVIKGTYNSWSYLVIGKISNYYNWVLEYKKATYTSHGDLLLSSEHQSLFMGVKWIAKNMTANCASFHIKRKKILHTMLLPLNPKLHKLCDGYVITSKESNSALVSSLLKILKPLFTAKEIYSIEYKNNTLTIDLRTKNTYYDIFEELFINKF